MNRLVRKIGIAIVSVAIATSQCIVYADDIQENGVVVTTEEVAENQTVIKKINTEIKIDEVSLTDNSIEDTKKVNEEYSEELTEESFVNITGSAIVIKVDISTIPDDESDISEYSTNEETVENDEKSEYKAIVDTDKETADGYSVINSIENEVTTGVRTMISIEENIPKLTGAACEIEIGKVIEEPIQVEPVQYIEKIEKVEIENLSDILNVNMSYTTVDYKRLNIKVSYDVALDIETGQIEIEDSFFGKTILKKVDGVYKGEASKIVGFEDVMQSLIVKGFYNTMIMEAIMPQQNEELTEAADSNYDITEESILEEIIDDSLGI